MRICAALLSNRHLGAVGSLNLTPQAKDLMRYRAEIVVRKIGWVALLAASVLFYGCAEDQPETIEVTGTASCQPLGQDASGVEMQECEWVASDVRASGTSIITYTVRQIETWEGTVTLTNDEGTWTGILTGARDGPAAISEGELFGQGPYEGLAFTFTATNPSVNHDGSGQNEVVGVIEPST